MSDNSCRYQMDEIIAELNALIDAYKSYITAENFKRYKAFLNELRYINSGTWLETTVYERITNLISQSGKKFTFVLGAGVSADRGIPNWEELIFRMNFSKYWQNMYGGSNVSHKLYSVDSETYKIERYETRENLKSGLFRLNSNLYEWAQYSENNYNEDEIYKERTYYMERTGGIATKTLDNTLYSVVKDSLYFGASVVGINDTCLNYICDIAEQKKVDRIITYNYDDCLEYCWGNGDYKCLPIFDKQQLYERKTNQQGLCEIYHVHGLIPHFSDFKEGGVNFKKIEEAFNSYDGKKLILTEISYDDMQEEIYKWRNDIQVDTLLRYSCIFVGFSATDVNFKRIVKQLSKTLGQRKEGESPSHFITICLDDYIKNIYYKNECVKDAEEFLKMLNDNTVDKELLYPFIMSAIEMMIDRKNYLLRYGIYPLFTTIKDLPILFCKINKSLQEDK